MILKLGWIYYNILAFITTLPIFLLIYIGYGMDGIYNFSRVYPIILVIFIFIYKWMFRGN